MCWTQGHAGKRHFGSIASGIKTLVYLQNNALRFGRAKWPLEKRGRTPPNIIFIVLENNNNNNIHPRLTFVYGHSRRKEKT